MTPPAKDQFPEATRKVCTGFQWAKAIGGPRLIEKCILYWMSLSPDDEWKSLKDAIASYTPEMGEEITAIGHEKWLGPDKEEEKA